MKSNLKSCKVRRVIIKEKIPVINNNAVVNCVSKVISELLWFCTTSPNDWFKVLTPLFQPIRSKTKTNSGSRVHIFRRFVSARCNYWFTGLSQSVLCD